MAASGVTARMYAGWRYKLGPTGHDVFADARSGATLGAKGLARSHGSLPHPGRATRGQSSLVGTSRAHRLTGSCRRVRRRYRKRGIAVTRLRDACAIAFTRLRRLPVDAGHHLSAAVAARWLISSGSFSAARPSRGQAPIRPHRAGFGALQWAVRAKQGPRPVSAKAKQAHESSVERCGRVSSASLERSRRPAVALSGSPACRGGAPG